MLWDDDEPKTRATVLLQKIRELRNKPLISIAEGNELEIYRRELAEIQKACVHWFRPVLLFSGHSSFCSKCDLEEVGYRRQD